MNAISKELEALLRLHAHLPRQGPGSESTTRQALGLIPALPQAARIYDLGCGPGRATMVLAGALKQKVVAIDAVDDFVQQVKENAERRGLSPLVEARRGDMLALTDEAGTIDLIWCEGAIYCVGFDQALRQWRPLISKGGVVACTEASWLTSAVSPEPRQFWNHAYPAMRTVAGNMIAAESLGYACLHHFTLPLSDWWDEYYTPLLNNIEKLHPFAASDPYLARAIKNANQEMDLFRHFNNEYGYVFYLLEKSEITIERAQPADAEEVSQLFGRSRSVTLPYLPQLHTPAQDLEYISRQVLVQCDVFVARNEQGSIVGFIAFNHEWVKHLYLAPECMRRGIGSRLLNIAKAHTERLRLWTFQKNDLAKQFYIKHGFQLVMETDGENNEEKEPDALLQWGLIT